MYVYIKGYKSYFEPVFMYLISQVHWELYIKNLVNIVFMCILIKYVINMFWYHKITRLVNSNTKSYNVPSILTLAQLVWCMWPVLAFVIYTALWDPDMWHIDCIVSYPYTYVHFIIIQHDMQFMQYVCDLGVLQRSSSRSFITNKWWFYITLLS